jgi:hypothetical protein
VVINQHIPKMLIITYKSTASQPIRPPPAIKANCSSHMFWLTAIIWLSFKQIYLKQELLLHTPFKVFTGKLQYRTIKSPKYLACSKVKINKIENLYWLVPTH